MHKFALLKMSDVENKLRKIIDDNSPGAIKYENTKYYIGKKLINKI